jgi:hypothetical protein
MGGADDRVSGHLEDDLNFREPDEVRGTFRDEGGAVAEGFGEILGAVALCRPASALECAPGLGDVDVGYADNVDPSVFSACVRNIEANFPAPMTPTLMGPCVAVRFCISE